MKLFEPSQLQVAHSTAAEKALRARERDIPPSFDVETDRPKLRAAQLLVSLLHWCDAEEVLFHDALLLAEQWFLEDVDGGHSQEGDPK
jgi:hypothetical protein